MIFNVQETFLSRKKNKRGKEKKEEKKKVVIEQFQYESAKHSPNYRQNNYVVQQCGQIT